MVAQLDIILFSHYTNTAKIAAIRVRLPGRGRYGYLRRILKRYKKVCDECGIVYDIIVGRSQCIRRGRARTKNIVRPPTWSRGQLRMLYRW